MSMLPQTIYTFDAILIKIPMEFFINIKKNLKICMELQKSLNNQSNPEKEEQSSRYNTSWCQTRLQSYSKNSVVLA